MQKNEKFNIKLLSVVIPAYKQERTIVQDIKKISEPLKELNIEFELIVVVDGIIDKTYQKISRLRSKEIKVIAYKKNEGKGHALRYGMMQANGDVVGFIDAGMDIHTEGFTMLLNHMEWYDAQM